MSLESKLRKVFGKAARPTCTYTSTLRRSMAPTKCFLMLVQLVQWGGASFRRWVTRWSSPTGSTRRTSRARRRQFTSGHGWWKWPISGQVSTSSVCCRLRFALISGTLKTRPRSWYLVDFLTKRMCPIWSWTWLTLSPPAPRGKMLPRRPNPGTSALQSGSCNPGLPDKLWVAKIQPSHDKVWEAATQRPLILPSWWGSFDFLLQPQTQHFTLITHLSLDLTHNYPYWSLHCYPSSWNGFLPLALCTHSHI